jgi:hypothetical protein
MQVRPASLATLLATSTVALALLASATAVCATSPDLSRVDSGELERAFWDCDARATRELLSAGDGALCVMVSDALKDRLFDGDFDLMLAWWRASKDAEHAKRSTTARPAATGYDDIALQAP